jgi:threonine/homoserine/homoserine lactone efflux protein
MTIASITQFFMGVLVVSIGALPFGLVNLSVVEIAAKSSAEKTIPVSFGASVIEVLFASIALLSGQMLSGYLIENALVRNTIVLILLISGIIFWFKKVKVNHKDSFSYSMGIIKGAFLNLISLQVLLFWLMAVSFLTVRNLIPISVTEAAIFIAGVWVGKMMVLQAYAYFGKIVVANSQKLSENINKIIGLMLIAVSIVQFIKL